MDYEQMEIDITLESDRDLKENMQATAKFALRQIMEYQHPTKVKNRHEGYGLSLIHIYREHGCVGAI